MARLTGPNGLQQMADLDTSWMRRAAVEWRNVELTEGAPNWTALSQLETLDLKPLYLEWSQ